MPLSDWENHLRTIRMTNPAWMPWSVGLCTLTWDLLGEELEQVVLRHPRTWPNYQPGEWKTYTYGREEDPEQGDYTDAWGCVWRPGSKGAIGYVVEHPLVDLSKLDTYVPPDPAKCNHSGAFDWEAHRQFMDREEAAGRSRGGSLDHGFHLLRLEYLCGFENLMCGLAEDTPEIRRLVDMVHAFNKGFLARMLDMGATTLGLPEDLGTQKGSMLGSKLFRKWVTPYHKELHAMAHARGAITGFHCDGNIMDVADQILEIGPDIFNPQDVLNGVDNLAEAFKGRLCIALDFDRQGTLPFGTPREIGELVAYEVKTLGSPRGGLNIQVEVRGEIPPENIDALATALEKYSTYWFD
ncbi:MAG: uroporphyrinogen decarboxylase family protein [Armatimonadota bacterium]